ncbi:MAG: radical SAM protein [Chloroflexota bacterium]
MTYEMPPFRPPSEAFSLLVRATRNCPWNKCAFCAMYKGSRFEVRAVADVKQDILKAKEIERAVVETAWRQGRDPRDVAYFYGVPWVRRKGMTAFIGDSNSIVMRAPDLAEIVRFLYETFPNLERVTSYGRASTVIKKPLSDLVSLKEAGLSRLHLGLETGDDFLLSWIDKGATAEQMIEAGRKVKEAGISLSEYVILGMGGSRWWKQHALGTARVLNAIDPDFIRVRTLMVYPGSPLHDRVSRGEFELAPPELILREERLLIENLDVTSEFVSDHVSNYLSINGTLPRDKTEMLAQLDEVIARLEEAPERRDHLLQPEHLRHL